MLRSEPLRERPRVSGSSGRLASVDFFAGACDVALTGVFRLDSLVDRWSYGVSSITYRGQFIQSIAIFYSVLYLRTFFS